MAALFFIFVRAGTAIPNVGQLSFSKVRLGGVYAIEPFVTLPEAAGRVDSSPDRARLAGGARFQDGHAL